MDSPGAKPPDAAVVDAGWGTLRQKGSVSDGRQESEEHAEAEGAEAGDESREEEVAQSSTALAEAAPGRSV
jgi:hypothetical protein